ncbi:MAG: phosphate ABC transporter ATP-binding protein [Pseudanabaenaceae cyanobacterium SKYGB_i_bin29]|nr:phosphate ABC transporter ATP-binding protein [Pseudanabaenaceae cyanobacterium SKYG29]MDW8421517.1 phosphate ABC transporter ATP-binding protein [Pseudanabaenaceae cyanobacterium SKYGB_i_bin29]
MNPEYTSGTVLQGEGVSIALDDVTVFYGINPAIQNVTLDIYNHSVTAFIGPSGCGKTTLLRCINRMNDMITSTQITGEIRVFGEDIQTIDPIELRRRVGMVFQRPNPFPTSIYENIALGLRVNGFRGNISDQVEKYLRLVGLYDEVKDRLKTNALQLSGGQQQRLCIARALALEPEIILMDEPCSSLDPISSIRIDNLITQLKKYFTVVIITHNLQQAARIADWIAFFKVVEAEGARFGVLGEYATSTDFFTKPASIDSYNYINTRIG